VDLYSALRLQV